jgi:hypothetical protein
VKSIAFLLTLLAVAASLHGSQRSSDSKPAATPPACTSTVDDAAIYSIALRQTVLKNRDDSTQVVLYSQTSAGLPPGLASSSYTSPAEREALDSATEPATKKDFDAKATLQCDLGTGIEPVGNVTLITARERNRFFNPGGTFWKGFNQKYPHAAGFTLLSAIGFNEQHRQALVYVGDSCNVLCGAGYLVLLEKKHDKWAAVKTAVIWTAGPASNE